MKMGYYALDYYNITNLNISNYSIIGSRVCTVAGLFNVIMFSKTYRITKYCLFNRICSDTKYALNNISVGNSVLGKQHQAFITNRVIKFMLFLVLYSFADVSYEL